MKGRRFKVQDSNHPPRNQSPYRNVAQPTVELYSNREQGRSNVLDGYSHHCGISRSSLFLNSSQFDIQSFGVSFFFSCPSDFIYYQVTDTSIKPYFAEIVCPS